MGMAYRTGMDFKYKDPWDFSSCLEIPPECSFSCGQTLETSERFSKDYTKASQSITRCKRLTAKTYSIQYMLHRQMVSNLFEELAIIEDSVGKTGELYQSDENLGLAVISSAAISFEPCSDGIASISVGLELIEALEPKKPAKRLIIDTYRS